MSRKKIDLGPEWKTPSQAADEFSARIASLESELAEVRRERDEAYQAHARLGETVKECTESVHPIWDGPVPRLHALRSALAASQEREGKLKRELYEEHKRPGEGLVSTPLDEQCLCEVCVEVRAALSQVPEGEEQG